jgi:L-threonylcarbamoyladenylate synthase
MRLLDLKEMDLEEALGLAVKALEGGGIVSYPTETFYALGARYDSEGAMERIFRLKGRPGEKAVSLVVGDEKALRLVAREVDEAAVWLMRNYWPGPLTIVLPAREGLSGYITSGGRVAVRMPGESFALRLARRAGFPITATSANPSGMPPAADAAAVGKYFAQGIDILIDGGPAPGGLPSTVVEATGGVLKTLRQGAAVIEGKERP